MNALEIVGVFALWMVGLFLAVFGTYALCMLRPGGLEVLVMADRVARICGTIYVLATIIYFIAT